MTLQILQSFEGHLRQCDFRAGWYFLGQMLINGRASIGPQRI